MPRITTANERWSAWVASLNFSLLGFLQSFIIFVFFVGDLLMSGRLVLVGALAIYDRVRRRDAMRRSELPAGGRGTGAGVQRREGH